MEFCADVHSSSFNSASSSTSSNAAIMTANFAFLNHSQQTIPQRLPPSVDNKNLARQKRRRTSPEDAAILETEFQRDPKPDKSERGRIAHRVALGEKEVQIWFQNRRSTTRRRARPLTPPTNQEDNQGGIEKSSTPSGDVLNTNSAPAPGQMYVVQGSQSPRRVQTPGNTIREEYPEIHTSEARDGAVGSPSIRLKDQDVDKPLLPCESTPESSGKETEAISGHLDNHTVHGHIGQQTEEHPNCSETVTQSKMTLRRTQSGVRLSMTSEGLATILGDSEVSPSPPKMRAGLEDLAWTPRGLRRSFSAAGLDGSLPPAHVTRVKSGIQRVLRGRSRDSRAWEFWCDRDSRNNLAKQAEQESTGSAADAISLMRSTSRSKLTPIQAERNVPHARSSSLKRSKSAITSKLRPNVVRSSSSIARLPSASQGIASSKGRSATMKPGGQTIPLYEFGSSDSDKENRAPFANEDSTVHADSFVKPLKTNRRPVLGESRTAPSQPIGADVTKQPNKVPRLSRNFHSNDSKENVHIDDEVARFMGGQDDFRQSDDLVVQGLLSLSQGAWR